MKHEPHPYDGFEFLTPEEQEEACSGNSGWWIVPLMVAGLVAWTVFSVWAEVWGIWG